MIEYKGFRIHEFEISCISVGGTRFGGFTHYFVSKPVNNVDVWFCDQIKYDDYHIKRFKTIASAKTFITKYLSKKGE